MKRSLGRMLVLLLAATAIGAGVNSVRSQRLPWITTREQLYPPPTATQQAAAITRDELRAAIDEGAVIIDARTEEKYLNGHIPMAHNVPAHAVHENIMNVFRWVRGPDDRVIIYCGGDECDESLTVYDALAAQGFTNLRLYFGGWKDWSDPAANMPIETGERADANPAPVREDSSGS